MKWLRINKEKGGKDSDEELLKQYLSSHDPSHIEVLFNRYISLVYGVCLKYLKDRTAAQDASMRVFERMITYLKSNEVHNFRSWLYTTSKNHCLMELRKKTTYIEKNNHSYMEFEEYMHPIDDIDEQNLQVLELCLENLNQYQRNCVELFYLKNNSYDQIAQQTGFEIKKIKSYLQNGRRNLKICMEKHEEKT